MKKITLFSILAAAIGLSACSITSPNTPVITRADATHETTGLGASKQKAQTAALESAKKQCGSLKNPVILEDKYTYNGVLDEKTGRMIEQGVSVVGAIFGTGAPRLSRNDDYEYYLKFRCE